LAADFNFEDTADSFGTHFRNCPKEELAKLCNCAVDEKCWAVAFSQKPWPLKLELCNHAGEPGHEHYDSNKHAFTTLEFKKITELFNKAAATKRKEGS
jgi:hypothetical protein